LLRLFDREALAGQIELVVRALLEPWISEKPEPEHRKAISELLLDQVGDPRLHRSRWDRIVRSLAETIGEERALTVTQVFKRWLTEVAMREFSEQSPRLPIGLINGRNVKNSGLHI
jgi:hypothetical protein